MCLTEKTGFSILRCLAWSRPGVVTRQLSRRTTWHGRRTGRAAQTVAEHDFHHSERAILVRDGTQRAMDRSRICLREEVFALLEGGLILDKNAVECLGVGHVEDWLLGRRRFVHAW